MINKTPNTIPKHELKDGQYYRGICRNASVAKWNSEKNCFTYMRTKFNSRFAEDINHFQDDNGFDLFFPYCECIDPQEHEKV